MGRALLALALAAGPIAAQQRLTSRTLDSGTVVRLHLEGGAREAGRLLTPFASDSGTLRFCRYPAPPCVPGGRRYFERPAESVWRLEVHRGTRVWLGAGVAAPIGAGIGVLFADFAQWMGEEDLPWTTEVRYVAVSTVVVSLLGALVGEAFDVWGPP